MVFCKFFGVLYHITDFREDQSGFAHKAFKFTFSKVGGQGFANFLFVVFMAAYSFFNIAMRKETGMVAPVAKNLRWRSKSLSILFGSIFVTPICNFIVELF